MILTKPDSVLLENIKLSSSVKKSKAICSRISNVFSDDMNDSVDIRFENPIKGVRQNGHDLFNVDVLKILL
jgi:hypothetical protein